MIIGLHGKAGTGKDTVAMILERIYMFHRTAFANGIKKYCMDIFAFSHLQCFGPSEYRNEPDRRYPRPDGTFLTPREALQKLGTEFGRSCYPNIWVELGLRQAKEALDSDNCSGVVFTDVRFPNELEAIRASGGKVVKIVRPGAGLTGEAANHPSEVSLDHVPNTGYDYVLDNSGDLEQLDSRVVEMMNVLRGCQ